ncbi:MAG: hypothetical protein FJY54_03000 [Betaproteobacteria bacterium]|nr:hypothetical protein [Betaproteobacteria bacterium]
MMPKSRLLIALIALACLAAGLVAMLAALDVIPSPGFDFRVSRWVVFVAGSLFVVIGMWLLIHAIAHDVAAYELGSAVGLSVMLVLAAIANWVAFGPGVRQGCTGDLWSLGFASTRAVADLECRIVFGYGAAFIDLFLLRAFAGWLGHHEFRDSSSVRALEKVSEWGISLLLLPLVAIAFLLHVIHEAGATAWNRLRGKK